MSHDPQGFCFPRAGPEAAVAVVAVVAAAAAAGAALSSYNTYLLPEG